MGQKILVILESPNKIRAVSEILRKIDPKNSYTVKASFGHITNLSKEGKFNLGINLDTFEEKYEIDPEKKDVVKELRNAAKDADLIYLSTDNDFEGALIAYTIVEQLKLPKTKLRRVTFTEITDIGVKNGLKNITKFDPTTANSARCRRMTDRIVGFQTSGIARNISAQSAGRVQSAALKIIVDREREIQNFVPEDFFELYLPFKKGNRNLEAQYKGTSKKKTVTFKNKKVLEKVIEECKPGGFSVVDIAEKERLVESKEPFTTATFQMECLAKFGMTSKKAMEVAQSLFEGKQISNSTHGLITYHRTDSARMSDEFVAEAKKFIEEKYTSAYYNGPKPYKKKENEQAGHECLRVTDPGLTPEKAKTYLDSYELKVYSLIYNRTLASLMVPSKVKDTDIVIGNGEHRFILTGHKTIFDGFRKVYIEYSEASDGYEDLPEFKLKEKIKDGKLIIKEKHTTPPNRYSEASFVKKMTDVGIGRPSTYAPTIETLKKRDYVKVEKKSLVPTDLGVKITELMEKYFPDIVDVKYTADMEKLMDEVAVGKVDYKAELKSFWEDFHPKVLAAQREIKKEKSPMKLLDEKCPICGAPLTERVARATQKHFLSCSRWPKCNFTKSIGEETSKLKMTKHVCPKCGHGFLVARKSKKGQVFYGCSEFSKSHCDFTMSEFDYKKTYNDDFSEESNDKEE